MSFIIGMGGPNWFSIAAKNVEGYIKDNGVDDRFLPNLRQMDKCMRNNHFPNISISF